MTRSNMPQFSVTYETFTEESLAAGEAEECGFLSEDTDLRTALAEASEIDYSAVEASQSPIGPGTWFTFYGTCFAAENRSIHPPRDTSVASLRRIALLIGAYS